MNYKSLAIGTVFLIGALPSALLGDTCKPSDPTGTMCTLHVDDVRPTQFAVGSLAVTCKAQKISEKSKKKLKKYLAGEKRLVPAIVGPDGDFFMTDHHHLSTALHRASSPKWGNKNKVIHIEIKDNFTTKDVTSGEFWEAMQQANNSYNFDNKGTPDMSFDLLPADVGGLLNDPYRTLSRWVRESCGYVKKGKTQCDQFRTDHDHEAPFFMEFYWGDFFRQKLPLPAKDLKVCKSIPYSETCLDDEVAQLKAIYGDAMKLAASEDAKQYFENQDPPLDPLKYGFNPSEEQHLKLKFSGYKDACEECDLKKDPRCPKD